LLELGCGNGRDAVFFASHGIKVTACDQCQEELEYLQAKFANDTNLSFINADFSRLSLQEIYDVIYSRFTLHSVTSEDEDWTIKWCSEHLKTGGLFLIEVRGQRNELYGQRSSC